METSRNTQQPAGGAQALGSDKPESRRDDGRRRAYIRHPAHVPIEVSRIPADAAVETGDVSHGGLAFASDHALQPGMEVWIRVPRVDPSFRARARVAWCRPSGDHYWIGVTFADPDDAFHSRMVEQLCAIESYRHDVRVREGREMTPDEAAHEWIERHASGFPSP
jgi:hypothetical protein